MKEKPREQGRLVMGADRGRQDGEQDVLVLLERTCRNR